jgi:hypothetical protein
VNASFLMFLLCLSFLIDTKDTKDIYTCSFIVYAATMGQFTTIAVQYCAVELELRRLKQPIMRKQYKLLAPYIKNGPEQTSPTSIPLRLTCSDFIIFQLLRIGQIELKLVDEVVELFKRLDGNNSGFISREDLQMGLYFVKSDYPESPSPSKKNRRETEQDIDEEFNAENVNIIPSVDELDDVLEKYITPSNVMDGGLLISKMHPLLQESLSNPGAVLLIVYSLFFLAGVSFYTLRHGWNVHTAFYFCVDGGLSIGFGDIEEPVTDDFSHAFTMILIICGSTVISGSTGFFISYMLDPDFTNMQKSIIPSFFSSYHNASFRARVWGLLFLWLLLGTFYCMISLNWSFITGMYFSILACSR